MQPLRTLSRRLGGAVLALSLALLPCGAPLSGALAQTIAGGGDEPIQIQADSGIEWQQNARLYIARGNAVATRGASAVRADTLIAYYRDGQTSGAGGDTEIYRVEAIGRVTLKRDTATVVGDRAVYDVDQGIAVITGNALKLTAANDTVSARDSLEWYDHKQIAVARGDAVATRDGQTIKADVLTAYLAKAPPQPAKPAAATGPETARANPSSPPAAGRSSPDSESQISRVDAQGNVVVTNALDTGRGDFGVYNGKTGIATLIGNVAIQRGNNVIRGHRGVMDLNNNISRMMPGGPPGEGPQRVQGLFIRDGRGAGAGAPEAGQPPAAGSARR
jgi:lipopolysaccharide export system protein LptA